MSGESKHSRVALLQDKPRGQLLVHEIYKSVQGESTFAGLPCIFVRLAVCDARCVWCDTPHAFNQGELLEPDAVLARVLDLNCPVVEFTGGEPLLQTEVLGLLTRLAELGLTVLLETSGLQPIDRVDHRVHIIMDLKCPDSGECEGNCWDNLERLKPTDQVKLVIASRRDFDWAVATIHKHDLAQRFTVLVSPAFGLVEPRQLAEWILDSKLHVRLHLQLHKYVWDPKARGV
ncbi:MAG: 7-carboxy-7-deazaguanine synthase QueE [Gemmataceae bacterium]